MELIHFTLSSLGHGGSVLTPTYMLLVDFPTSSQCITWRTLQYKLMLFSFSYKKSLVQDVNLNLVAARMPSVYSIENCVVT